MLPRLPAVSIVSLSLLSSGPAQGDTNDAALVARARRIHARVMTLDTHKDIRPTLALQNAPTDPKAREEFEKRNDPTVRGLNQVDFPKMRDGGYDAGFFIVYVGQGPLTEAGFKRAKAQALAKFDAIDRMCRYYADDIELARTPADVVAIHDKGKLVACIGIENGYPMGTDLSLIRQFHARGARYMGITHNGHSQLGDSHTPEEPLHGGLSELGKKAVLEMNRAGIMVDVSHSSKQTMLDAVELSKAPVIASHSGVRALCPHGRNLDDEQLRALARNCGVVQIVAFSSYVKDYTARRAAEAALRKELGLPSRRGRGRGQQGERQQPVENLEQKLAEYRERLKTIDVKFPRSTVADFVDHIDYAVKLIGIDHVGISSDFDGGGGVIGWNDASETFNVTLELVRRGYTEAQIAKLWAKNTLRVWRDVERIARDLEAK